MASWVETLDLDSVDNKPYEGELGFAFIGYCSDEGVKRNKGRSGAEKGPDSIRKELADLPCCFNDKVKLFDAGNIYSEKIFLEESQDLLSKAVTKILNLNLFPIVLGGGHELAFGHYNGLNSYFDCKDKRPKIGIINFDAHFDLRPYNNGGNSGTMFRQIYDLCKNRNLTYSYLCLGIQKHCNTIDLFKTANEIGVEYVLAKDMLIDDNWNTIKNWILT